MSSKATIAEVAAMFRAFERISEERHVENVKRLDEIRSETKSLANEARIRNGRIQKNEVRIEFLEDAFAASTPRSSNISLDWKRIGSGAGLIAFLIWGAVDVLRMVFHAIDSMGAFVMGKK